jgi:hypothetical protein
MIACDEDLTPRDVYGEDDPRSSKEFSDGSWRLHSDCLTNKEQLSYRENE